MDVEVKNAACAVCEEPLYKGEFYVGMAGDPNWFVHLAACHDEFEEMGPNTLTCVECGELIGKDEVRISIPDPCDKDVTCCGYFHRDCGLYHEVGEDGFLFEENVARLFGVFKNVLTNWCDPEPVRDYMLPQINRAVEQLNKDIQEWLKASLRAEVQ